MRTKEIKIGAIKSPGPSLPLTINVVELAGVIRYLGYIATPYVAMPSISTTRWSVGVKLIASLAWKIHPNDTFECLLLALDLYARTYNSMINDTCTHGITCFWMAQKMIYQVVIPPLDILKMEHLLLSVISLERHILILLKGVLYRRAIWHTCTTLEDILLAIRTSMGSQETYVSWRPSATATTGTNKYNPINTLKEQQIF